MSELELVAVEDIKVKKGMTEMRCWRPWGARRLHGPEAGRCHGHSGEDDKEEGMLRILSFPACIMATGTRGILSSMVKNHMVDLK
jgi:deoxyhypusine synthase